MAALGGVYRDRGCPVPDLHPCGQRVDNYGTYDRFCRCSRDALEYCCRLAADRWRVVTGDLESRITFEAPRQARTRVRIFVAGKLIVKTKGEHQGRRCSSTPEF